MAPSGRNRKKNFHQYTTQNTVPVGVCHRQDRGNAGKRMSSANTIHFSFSYLIKYK